MNQNLLEKANQLDKNDGLSHFRDRFFIPQHNGQDCIYLTGNSLGLQPKSAIDYLKTELNSWKEFGVEGHFMGPNPWMYYHKMFASPISKIVGAKESEVVVMNSLTTNLHLLMVSFYQPTKTKFKILMEGGAFPSDQYAIETQIKFHGFDPNEAIIEVFPRDSKAYLETEDILSAIDLHKDELALVMFSGVNYYTGQVFDMKSISQKANEINAKVGFDLAHAAGNIELELHNWNVDFACWCSYKYLNSGPGAVSGIFVNEKHHKNKEIPRFGGWWGHEEETRFQMKKGFIPMQSAEAWQLSNAPVFNMAILKASLDIFIESGGMKILSKKRELLSNFAFECIEEINSLNEQITVLTPNKPDMKGAQLSIVVKTGGKKLFQFLQKNGVISDWREPDVIRIAPVPLYNSFNDVYRFCELVEIGLKEVE